MGESATPVKAVPEAASSSASPPPPTSAQIPPRPASKPVGELYRIRPWHTVTVLTLALLLDLPFLIDRLALSPYTSHTTGGVLVTGASTGIGRDAAITLATKEPGLIVYAGVRNLRDAKAITALHLPNLLPVTMDVTKDNSVQAARRTILKDLASRGPEPDNPLPFVGLVNNAGVTGMAPLEHHALPEVEKIFAVNVFGLLRVTQAFLPEIRKHQGRIINISSVLGALTVSSFAAYSASKHAMESLSDGLRRELRPFGVSVSVIQPGFVASPIHAKAETAAPSPSSPASTDYPHLSTPAKRAHLVRCRAHAASPRSTSAAVADALLQPFPRTRYPVAAVDRVPAVVFTLAAAILPDRVMDSLLEA